MKKFVLSVSLGFACVFATAQKFTKVETPYVLGKIEEAKIEIDKMAADPKVQTSPEFWLWHATIYGSLYDNNELSVKYPGSGETALNSFRKYQQVDAANKVMNDAAIPGKLIVDVLYRGNLRQGIAYFDKKQWDSAFKYFGQSAEIGDLITRNNWKGNKQPVDTITVLFTGYAAQNAKKAEEAAKYYSRIADLKIKSVPATGDVKDIYEYLVYHFLDKKDTDNFNKYLGLAKELYPEAMNSWADYESEYVEKNYSLAQKEAAYDKGDAAGTLTANQYLSYGNMFYNIREDDREKLDSAQLAGYRSKAEAAFSKGYEKDNNNGLAAFNVGLINYNEWVDLDDQFEANIKRIAELNRSKAEVKDPKKKAANDARVKKEVDAIRAVNAGIEKKQHAFADKAAQWFETTHKVLSVKATPDRAEKQVLGKSVDNLTNLYLWKRDKSKGNNAEYDKYDALYKKYDALHGKY